LRIKTPKKETPGGHGHIWAAEQLVELINGGRILAESDCFKVEYFNQVITGLN
jgi:hypothetical protein